MEKTFIGAMLDFFKRKQGQSLEEFRQELANLDPKDREYFERHLANLDPKDREYFKRHLASVGYKIIPRV